MTFEEATVKTWEQNAQTARQNLTQNVLIIIATLIGYFVLSSYVAPQAVRTGTDGTVDGLHIPVVLGHLLAASILLLMVARYHGQLIIQQAYLKVFSKTSQALTIGELSLAEFVERADYAWGRLRGEDSVKIPTGVAADALKARHKIFFLDNLSLVGEWKSPYTMIGLMVFVLPLILYGAYAETVGTVMFETSDRALKAAGLLTVFAFVVAPFWGMAITHRSKRTLHLADNHIEDLVLGLRCAEPVQEESKPKMLEKWRPPHAEAPKKGMLLEYKGSDLKGDGATDSENWLAGLGNGLKRFFGIPTDQPT